MPAELDDDEKREIIEKYRDYGTQTEVIDNTDYSKYSVQKYVNAWKDGELDVGISAPGEVDDSGGEERENFTADPPGNTAEQIDGGRPDFSTLSPGEFIRWFFNQDGFGVKEGFADRLAAECDMMDAFPDKTMLANRIVSADTGIGNESDAEMIANVYESVLEDYRYANGAGSRNVRPGGSRMESNQRQQAPGRRSGDEDGWKSATPDGGHNDPPRRRNDGGGYDRARGGGRRDQRDPARQQSPRDQRGGGGGDDKVDRLAESIEELKKTQMQMLRAMNNQDSGDEEPHSFKQQAQELAEAHNALESFLGDDDKSDERVEALQEELREMRREVAQADDGGGQQINGDGSGVGMIAQLAMQDDVDPEVLQIIAESTGVTDPEVKKAEYEFKQTREKLENRKELMDNFFDNLGDASGEMIGAAFEAFAGGDDEEAAQGAASEMEGEVEGDMPDAAQMGSGEIQVVGENTPESDQTITGQVEVPDNDGGGGSMSPAREKHADNIGAGSFSTPGVDEGGGGGGGFDAGGGGEPAGGCQWMEEDGSQCGAETVEGEVFCSDHVDVGASSGDFQ